MRIFTALVAGIVFGVGLTVAEMVNPAKVLAFLDFAGDWDPSLALVMAGALAVTAPAYYLARRRGRAALGGGLEIPTRRDIDPRLAAGAVIFGVGWGLVGFCPGPAIAALGFGAAKVWIFFAAMLAGMAIFAATAAPSAPRPAGADRTA